MGRHRGSSRAVRQDRRRDALAADVRVVYQRRLHEVDPLGDGSETRLPGRQLLGRVARVGAGRRRRYVVAHQNGVSFCTAEADHVAHSPQVFSPDRQQPAVRRAERPQQRLRQPEDCSQSTTIGIPLASS